MLTIFDNIYPVQWAPESYTYNIAFLVHHCTEMMHSKSNFQRLLSLKSFFFLTSLALIFMEILPWIMSHLKCWYAQAHTNVADALQKRYADNRNIASALQYNGINWIDLHCLMGLRQFHYNIEKNGKAKNAFIQAEWNE